MAKMTWFRVHGDIVYDDKLRLLAFEDRWHFMAVLAMKCNGLIDEPDNDLRTRRMAVCLGVQLRELDEIKRRLLEVGLIGDDWQPAKWDKRQYKQPDLPAGESLEGYRGYVYFIADDTMETVKIGYSKNPWARVKDLQTGRKNRLHVVATLKTTGVSEADVHWVFKEERISGEWFDFSPRIQGLVKDIKAKKVRDIDGLKNYFTATVATVATTTEADTDTEADTEEEKNTAARSRLKRWAVRPDDVSEVVWQAFRQHRKSAFTDLALQGFRREAAKAGWTLEAAITEAAERGWQGFKADWVKEKTNGRQQGSGDPRDGLTRAIDSKLHARNASGSA
jgi:hypothetical protein